MCEFRYDGRQNNVRARKKLVRDDIPSVVVLTDGEDINGAAFICSMDGMNYIPCQDNEGTHQGIADV